MYPVATEMWLHLTAGEAAAGALKTALIRSGFFHFWNITTDFLFCSPYFPRQACLQSLASLSVPFPGSCLLWCLHCQLAGLIYLCSGLSSAETQQLWRPVLGVVSGSSCPSSTTRAPRGHLQAHHSIVPLLLSYAGAHSQYFKAGAHTSASFSRWASNREGPRAARSAVAFWE